MIQNDYKIGVTVGRPKVAYKMTLRGPKQVEARHIKQSGGSGQFAVARVKFRPDETVEEFTFIDSVKGGSVPREYIPAVEAGIEAAIKGGGRIGFPYCKIVGELYDGQSHDVDSSSMAFEAAGVLAFRLAAEGNSLLLEPIMKIEIEAPEEKTGDVIGDRRHLGRDRQGPARRDVPVLDEPAFADAGTRHLHDGARVVRAGAAEHRREGARGRGQTVIRGSAVRLEPARSSAVDQFAPASSEMPSCASASSTHGSGDPSSATGVWTVPSA
jgi:hypothetical protein